MFDTVTYRRVTTIWNRDDIPSDPVTTTFTQHEPTGPNVSPGDMETKQNTKTPTVTLTDPGAANIDQARVEWLNEAGTLLSDTGVIAFSSAASRNVTAPTGIYDWGAKPRLRAYVRVTGTPNLGPAREVQIRINATPGSPYPLSLAGGVVRDDGVWVSTDSTPDLLIPFRDVDKDDGYTEAPKRREVEVRTMADAHHASSPYVSTTLPLAEMLTLPTLTADTTYKARARYDDNADVRSAFSDYLFVRYSQPPTLTGVTPAAAATVTDPTPTFAWTYGSPGGKPQSFWQLVALVGATEVYNSGKVAGDAAEVTFEPHLLDTGQSVEWTLTVWDSDGLSTSLTRTFSTSFTVPAPPASLVLTPDDDEHAIIVDWAESALPAQEFYAYIVSARTEGGQFRVVTTILAKGTTAFVYRAAAHNRETIVRVTVSNGWAESEPVEGSLMLTAEGYWLRSSGSIESLEHVTGHGPGDTQTKSERLEPLGRSDVVVLNWGSTGYEGDFALLSSDRSLLERLRGYKERGEVVMLKFPYGAVRYAVLLATPDTDQVGEWYGGTIEYVEVSPEAATF